MRLKVLLVAMVAAPLSAAAPARAEYPDHPIRYILHVSAGGATDMMARKLAASWRK